MKLYDNPTYQAAFERWVDLMAQLILKYGPALLEKMEATGATDCNEQQIAAPTNQKTLP